MATHTLTRPASTVASSLASTLASAALLAFTASASWALDSKPHVVVNFDIVAPAFKLNLPQRSAAQATLGNEIASQVAQRYAFADWTLTPRDDQARLGTLSLRLEEEPNTVPNPRIVVKWYGGADAASAKELAIPPIEVYAPTNPNWDTNSRANFETRVTDKLREAMRSDAFFEQFFKVFLRTLPIAKQVRTAPADRAIDLPVTWRELLLAPESVVVVRFRRASDAGAEAGTLTLNPVAPRRVVLDSANNVTATLLRGAVDEAVVGVHRLDLVGNWNDRLPALLNNAEVRAYLVEYKPLDFADTDDGLVLDLQ